MANQGWVNDGGRGVQTSSTANSAGHGTVVDDAEAFVHVGSKAASTGGETLLDMPSDVFEPAGQLATTPEI